MLPYVMRRLLATVPTLLLLVFAVVMFARLTPTSVIDVILQEQSKNQVTRHQLEARLGLDKSLPNEYVDYIGGAVKGDFGKSLLNGRSVRTLVFDRLPITLELATYALIMGWGLGCTIGIISAIRRGGALDYILRMFAILGLTVPNFALGTAVVILPSVYFHWAPPLIYKPFSSNPVGHIEQFALAAAVLAVSLSGGIMRIVRTQMLEVLRQDYMRTGRAKGLATVPLIWRHALRNAMIPVVSVFGLQLAIIFGGSVIIEQIFALPGIGTLLLNAVGEKDWPIVQGVTLLVGAWIIAVNLLVDLSYAFLDPRIKLGARR
jgi:peptide/nickel transport system permease protein